MQLFAKISADVNSILNGLQGNIRELEVKINAFVQKEQQVYKHATRYFYFFYIVAFVLTLFIFSPSVRIKQEDIKEFN